MRKMVWLTGALLTLAHGQNAALLAAYTQHNIPAIEKMVQSGVTFESETEKRFYTALLEPDAEKAVAVYKHIFEQGSALFKYLSADRLHDYYYARGYYTTAADYGRYLADHEKVLAREESPAPDVPAETADNEQYYIQVGAFGMADNARQMVNMLRTQNYSVRVKERVINNRTLYCVWVNGAKDFQATLKLADQLRQKYHLNYKLIKE